MPMRMPSIVVAWLAIAGCQAAGEGELLSLGEVCDRNRDCASDFCAGSLADNCTETCQAPPTEGSVCAQTSDTGLDCTGSFRVPCPDDLRCTLASPNNLADQFTSRCLGPQSEGTQCFSESDHACEDGLVCVGPDAEHMQCATACESDDQCGEGAQCAAVGCGRHCIALLREDALCVQGASPSSCAVSARCGDGLECGTGSGDGAFCGEPAEEGESCRTDLPLDDRDPADDGCADGLICAGGVCAPP